MVPEGERVPLHICCAPDASYGVPAMQMGFSVVGFFFNPNIQPGEEYVRRLLATRQLQDAFPFALTVAGGGGGGGGRAGKRPPMRGGPPDASAPNREGSEIPRVSRLFHSPDRQPEKGRRDGQPGRPRGGGEDRGVL